MATARSKHLTLILAREFASNLATPTLIADAEGTSLDFFNAGGRHSVPAVRNADEFVGIVAIFGGS